MAKPLKVAGLQESEALRRRVRRQLAMRGIAKDDADYLIDLLDKFDARVVKMREENGEEEY